MEELSVSRKDAKAQRRMGKKQEEYQEVKMSVTPRNRKSTHSLPLRLGAFA
jgi:hypothetical protein